MTSENPKLTYTFACFHFFPTAEMRIFVKKTEVIRITLVSWHFGMSTLNLLIKTWPSLSKKYAVFHRLPAITSMRFLEQSTIATQLVVLMPCRPPLRPRSCFFIIWVFRKLWCLFHHQKKGRNNNSNLQQSNSPIKSGKTKENNWETKKNIKSSTIQFQLPTHHLWRCNFLGPKKPRRTIVVDCQLCCWTSGCSDFEAKAWIATSEGETVDMEQSHNRWERIPRPNPKFKEYIYIYIYIYPWKVTVGPQKQTRKMSSKHFLSFMGLSLRISLTNVPAAWVVGNKVVAFLKILL